MIFAKTEMGQLALKERQGGRLTPRQRSAFILFDGQRTAQQVLAATAAMGITMDDVQAMVDLGLLGPRGSRAPASGADEGEVAPDDEGSDTRSAMERYKDAYPIAIELTAGLGLRGFRLNLAVEGTTGYEELLRLAPRIREAVGDAPYARLERALSG